VTATIHQVCILVGGKGARLSSISRSIPKPLFDIVDGVTFLDFLIEEVTRQGFDDIILLAGHLGHLVQERYRDRSLGPSRVRVLIEPEPRGTGGALLSAREILSSRFLLLNGDSFFDTNLRALAAQAVRADCEALLALRWVDDASRYGAVDMEGDRIVRFREKDDQSSGPALINAGAYFLASTIVDRIPSLPCSIETQIFPGLAADRKLYGSPRGGYFIDIGLPETLEQARRELPALRRRPAVFLDRDGVINVDHGYVHRPDQFEWVPGAQSAVRLLNDLGYRVIVVTNQAGVAHGYYDEEQMHTLHIWLKDCLASDGAFIDAFYHCFYHPDASVERFRAVHGDRKPNPGMILRALSDNPIDRRRSFLIGDKQSDIEAARGAGIPGFLFTGGNLIEFVERCLAGSETGAGV